MEERNAASVKGKVLKLAKQDTVILSKFLNVLVNFRDGAVEKYKENEYRKRVLSEE